MTREVNTTVYSEILSAFGNERDSQLTSVLTSRTDMKSLDIEASLDCGQQKIKYTLK